MKPFVTEFTKTPSRKYRKKINRNRRRRLGKVCSIRSNRFRENLSRSQASLRFNYDGDDSDRSGYGVSRWSISLRFVILFMSHQLAIIALIALENNSDAFPMQEKQLLVFWARNNFLFVKSSKLHMFQLNKFVKVVRSLPRPKGESMNKMYFPSELCSHKQHLRHVMWVYCFYFSISLYVQKHHMKANKFSPFSSTGKLARKGGKLIHNIL